MKRVRIVREIEVDGEEAWVNQVEQASLVWEHRPYYIANRGTVRVLRSTQTLYEVPDVANE